MSNKTSFFSGSGVTTNQTNAIQSSVEAAEADRLAAAASAAAAAASATTSSTKAGEASTSASASETSKLASVAAKAAAETAETNAETAETNAETAEYAALVSQNSASASASTATTKASEASTSAAAALVSKNSATTSASTATTKAAEGVVSAAAALVSKNASVAAQAAAETAETNSETAEAASLVSKNAAAASAAAALISKNSATASAATATTKASEAASSASSITGAQSASNASAVAAAASQVAAAASAASAATTYDTFDDRYLGAKSGFAGAGTGPSTDNDGNALVEGALFFSSAANEMRVFDGSGFIAASAAGSVSINTFRYTATAGQTTFTGNDEASNALAYTVGNILLSVNGVLLENPTDYAATSGTSIVLVVAAELDDEINITVFKSFTTADMVSATTGGTHQALVNFSSGINVTGNIAASGTVDGVDIAARDAVLSSTVTTANAALPKSGGALTGALTTNSTIDGRDVAADGVTADAALPKSGGAVTGNVTFGDGNKAIFGAGSDLQIYHDGSNSYIKDVGTGHLKVFAEHFFVNNSDDTEQMIGATVDGAVDLFFNGSKKFETTNTGISVTGAVTADGLEVSGLVTLDDYSGNSGRGRINIGNSGQKFIEGLDTGNGGSGSYLKIGSGSTTQLTIDNAGNVGIGTATFGATYDKLAVAGGINLQDDYAGKLEIGRYSSGVPNSYIKLGANSNSLRFTNKNDSADLLTIENGGNVGIGTSSPLSTMHLSTTGGGSVYLQDSNATSTYNISEISNNSGNFGIQTRNSSGTFVSTDYQIVKNASGADYHRWFTQGTERMRIVSDGSVAIGTSAFVDTSKVQIQGAKSLSSGIPRGQLNISDQTAVATGVGGSINFSGNYSGTSKTTYGSIEGFKDNGTDGHYGGSLVFKTRTHASDNIERMRIDSSGGVGLSKTPDSDAYLSIDYLAGSKNGLRLRDFSYYSSQHALVIENMDSNAARNHGSVHFVRNGNVVGGIQVRVSSTTYATSSDYRLKTDAQPMVGATARVQALNPVNFEWIADGTRVDGFLAHEAATVVPEAVTGTKDAMMDQEYEVTPAVLNENGTETTAAVMGTRSVPDYQGIDQSKIVPLLTAALQEALTKIDDMETRLAALEAN